MEWLKNLAPKYWWHLLAVAGFHHPVQERIGIGFKITDHPRRFTFLGTVFDAIGLVLAVYGAYRLLLL